SQLKPPNYFYVLGVGPTFKGMKLTGHNIFDYTRLPADLEANLRANPGTPIPPKTGLPHTYTMILEFTLGLKPGSLDRASVTKLMNQLDPHNDENSIDSLLTQYLFRYANNLVFREYLREGLSLVEHQNDLGTQLKNQRDALGFYVLAHETI